MGKKSTKPTPSMLGTGLAAGAAKKLGGRKRKLDEEIEKMSNPRFDEMKRKLKKKK